MFGLKLRSWMENHIVRPRKKGNKNKNAASNASTSQISPPQNGFISKGATFQLDPTITACSPSARRSEVSPIQNHTTSRAGWQSPQENCTMSPQSDRFEYRFTTSSSSNTSPRNPKTCQSSRTVENLSLNPKGMQQYQSVSKTIDPKHLSAKSTDKGYTKKEMSNIFGQVFHQKKTSNAHNYSTTASSSSATSNEMLLEPKFQMHKNSNRYFNGDETQSRNLTKSVGIAIENVDLHQKESKTGHAEGYNTVVRRKEQTAVEINVPNIDNTESKYGKILPPENRNNIRTVSNSNYKYDEKVVQFRSAVKCEQLVAANHYNPFRNSSDSPNSLCSANLPKQQFNHLNDMASHQNLQHFKRSSVPLPPSNGQENFRNILRVNSYPSKYGTNLSVSAAAAGHPQLGHVVFNSLSSPESAYSTGYSTDGTSPGTSNTPEYYINMRTGTHYFPRSGSAAVENTRNKFGLNKIDETFAAEPNVPKKSSSHRRTESCDLGCQVVRSDPSEISSNLVKKEKLASTGLSPDIQRRLAIQSYKGLESPSPRQRCRIRTNPWFLNAEATQANVLQPSLNKHIDVDARSLSSGFKSSDTGGQDNGRNEKHNLFLESAESSSSSRETEACPTVSPIVLRKNALDLFKGEFSIGSGLGVLTAGGGESDEDATLNELMGKFDESYCYEKETDILSDTDPTECLSELDTGLDGGDECDTDELLDIDYIDTGSIQEIIDNNHLYENTGSCSYYNFQSNGVEQPTSRIPKMQRSRNYHKLCDEAAPAGTSSKRRKKLTRTKKRSTTVDSRSKANDLQSSEMSARDRGSMSLGSTPLSLRRNKSKDKSSETKMVPLTYRSNSLTFTEIHSVRSRILAIAESEKALLQADLEADVKYKQLIHEAETMLISIRDTPVASPRRICNVPTNKRVEMLRNCDADLRRELAKLQKCNENQRQMDANQDNIMINKRIEVLKFETTSVPASPKANNRCSPRRTHVTNFIYQNVSPIEIMKRKNSLPDQVVRQIPNGKPICSPVQSPKPLLTKQQRYRSQSPKVLGNIIDSDSDSDDKTLLQEGQISDNLPRKIYRKSKLRSDTINNNIRNTNIKDSEQSSKRDSNLAKATKESARQTLIAHRTNGKPQLLSFPSINIGQKCSTETSYCPQSEPLKRKIYSGSSTLERLKKSLELESEIPKKHLLQKISHLREERQKTIKAQNFEINGGLVMTDYCNIGLTSKPEQLSNHYPINQLELKDCNENRKRQLILSTIEDLKRSLEDQSVELCGLNDDDV